MPFTRPLSFISPSVDTDPVTGLPVASPDVQGQPGGFQPPMPRFEATNMDNAESVPVTPPPEPVIPPPGAPLPAGASSTPPVVAAPPPLSPPVANVAPAPLTSPAPAVGGDLRSQARQIAVDHGVDPDLFDRLVTQESGWNPRIVSPAGAMGLTQLMPGTARSLGVSDPFDPVQSLQGGARYLRQMIDYFGGSIEKGVAAYNAGPGNIEKGIYPEETQRYVKALLGGLGTASAAGAGVIASAGALAPTIGTRFATMSATGGQPVPPAPAGNPPDVRPIAPYQPGLPPTSLVDELTAGQQQGLVPTPQTAPGAGLLDAAGNALGTVGNVAGAGAGIIASAGGQAAPYIPTSMMDTLKEHLRHTLAGATYDFATARTPEEMDAALKSLSQAAHDAAMQLTGNTEEAGGLRPPGELPLAGETPSQAWARLNAEAQAGMGRTTEPAPAPVDVPSVVTPSATEGVLPPPVEDITAAQRAREVAPGEPTPLPTPPVVGTASNEAAAAGATTRPRQTYESLAASPLDTPIVRELITGDPYTPIHDPEVIAAASARVEANPRAALKMVLDDSRPLDTNGIADAMMLARKAVNDGDMESIKAITKRLASEGTEAGQKLQIFRYIDQLSPEGTITELWKQLAKATRGRGVAKTQKALNQAEADIIRQKADTRIAAIDAIRQQSAAVKTVEEAVSKGRGIQYDDFLRGMQDLLREGKRPRSAQAGAVRSGPLIEVAPEDAARFYQRGQEVMAIADPAQRAAARDALLSDIRAHRTELTQAARAQERAAVAAEKLKTTQAAREVAGRRREAATGLNQFEREQAQAIVQPVEEAAKAERLRLEQDQSAADKAVRDAAAQLERAKRLQDRTAAQKAVRDAAEQKRAADKALAQQEAAAEAPQQAELKAAAMLERQKQAAPERNAAALGRQQVRETEAERLARESGITYLSDREARAAKEQIRKTAEEEVKVALKRQAKAGEIELPDAVAANLWDRATVLRDMPTSTPDEKYTQLLAGRQLMGDLSRYAPKSAWGPILDAWGLPRALETTLDNSFTLAQGGLYTLSHPLGGLETAVSTTRAWLPDYLNLGVTRLPVGKLIPIKTGEEYARSIEAQFIYGQHSPVMKETGLVYDDRFILNKANNEFYPTSLAAKIPGVAQSERAFSSGGNKLRMDLWRRQVNSWLPDELKGRSFDSLKELAKATGKNEQDFRELSNYLNAWTGKGNLPDWMKTGSSMLNMLFFAPRFVTSQLQVPYYGLRYGLGTAALRPMIARDFAGLATSLGTIYGLASWAASQRSDVKIQNDPLQSGYGDIQVGNHHINPLLGYGPLIHYIAMAATGKKHAGGKEYNQAAGDTFMQWLRSKVQPPAGATWDTLRNADVQGNPVTTPSPRDPSETAMARFFGQDPTTRSGGENFIRYLSQTLLPMLGTDVASVIAQDGVAGAAIVAPFQAFGGRANVYQTTAALRNQTAQQMGLGLDYAALPPFDKAKVDAAPALVQAYAEQDARQSGVSDTARTTVTMENYLARTKAIEEGYNDPQTGTHHFGLQEIVKQGMTGAPLVAAIKTAKDARYQNGLANFNALYEAAKGQPLQPEARDLLRQAYQSAEVPEDPITHELNFAARDNQRIAILKQAQAAGINPDYLTQKVSPWKDKATADAVAAYDKDQETLRPYYDMGKALQNTNASFRAAVLEDERLKAASGTQAGALALQRFERADVNWRRYQASVDQQRQLLRRKDKDIQEAGMRLGRWAPLPTLLGVSASELGAGSAPPPPPAFNMPPAFKFPPLPAFNVPPLPAAAGVC